MSQDTENFDSLRRLLAIKRHEQPPPGYFNSFSREVIVRIRAGERGEDAHGFVWQMGWMQKILSFVQAKPALVGGLGFAACALVVFSVMSADGDSKMDLRNVAAVTPGMQTPQGMQVGSGISSESPVAQAVEFSDNSPIRATVASMDVKPSLFDLVPQVQTQPASLNLSPASGN